MISVYLLPVQHWRRLSEGLCVHGLCPRSRARRLSGPQVLLMCSQLCFKPALQDHILGAFPRQAFTSHLPCRPTCPPNSPSYGLPNPSLSRSYTPCLSPPPSTPHPHAFLPPVSLPLLSLQSAPFPAPWPVAGRITSPLAIHQWPASH